MNTYLIGTQRWSDHPLWARELVLKRSVDDAVKDARKHGHQINRTQSTKAAIKVFDKCNPRIEYRLNTLHKTQFDVHPDDVEAMMREGRRMVPS